MSLWVCQFAIWRCRRNMRSLAISSSLSGTFMISPAMVTFAHRGSCQFGQNFKWQFMHVEAGKP